MEVEPSCTCKGQTTKSSNEADGGDEQENWFHFVDDNDEEEAGKMQMINSNEEGEWQAPNDSVKC